MLAIPLHPPLQVIARREAIRFFPLQVLSANTKLCPRSTGPRDEVIHMHVGVCEQLGAVEAPAVLHLGEDGAHRLEYSPLRAEKEFIEISCLSEQAQVSAAARSRGYNPARWCGGHAIHPR